MGNYAGTFEAEFTIAKAKNTMTAKAKTVKAKASKKTTIKKTKAFTVKKAQGKVTFKKASGNKKITVSKTGKVVVKKGLKKGKTFSVKVKVTAAGNKNYKKLVKTVTLKVKVVK
jgi:endo-1,4-beta-xylanase